jgi:hypothetical protein
MKTVLAVNTSSWQVQLTWLLVAAVGGLAISAILLEN